MPRQGPQGEAEGGACCKEVVSAPQILATLPLSYRNTDGAALSFTPRPLKSVAAAAEVKARTLWSPCPSPRRQPIIVGGPTSKKTPAMSMALRPVRERQMALKVEYERQREEYESALRALHGC